MIFDAGKVVGVNRIVVALSLARLAEGIGNSVLFVVIPLYVLQLPVLILNVPSPTRAALAISVYGLVGSFSQPIMGSITDHLGRRVPLIVAGLASLALSAFLFLFVRNAEALLLLRAGQGVAAAMVIASSLGLLAEATERGTRGRSMGFYTGMRMFGLAIGPLAGGVLVTHLGFDSTFLSVAGLCLLSGILVHRWVEEVARPSPTEPFHSRVVALSMLTHGTLGLSLAMMIMASAFSMIAALEVEFNARLDQTPIGFGVAFGALLASRLPLQFPLGRLSDLIGRKPLIISGLAVMALATPLIGMTTTTLQLTLLRVVQGAASAAIGAPAYALAADLSAAGSEGRQLSTLAMGFGLGVALGPLVAGVLAPIHFRLPFIIVGIASLAAALIVKRYTHETAERGELLQLLLRHSSRR